jgi:predicted  nucleic acid-binding Zn-ribbon protein
MPSKCTYCGKVHVDGAPYLMKGCDECGCKFFFFVKEDALPRVEEEMGKFSRNEISQMENDVRGLLPDVAANETVVLDIEAIRVAKPGKYEIDVTQLFSQSPIVIKVGPGKYEIDLSTIANGWKAKRKGLLRQ